MRARGSLVTKRPQPRLTVPISTPAPIKGLNTVDSLAVMDPTYGLSIQNFIATPQGLSVREGYRRWGTGFAAPVTALLPYNSANSAASKLFAVAGSSIYDVTSGGAIGAAAVTGLSSVNVYWNCSSMTFSTSGKAYLMCVNGSDSPRLYDGTSWTTTTQVASPATPGQYKTTDSNGNTVNMQNFTDVLTHQQRLWFTNANSTAAYYGDIGAVGGNLNYFDFGPLFPRGGHLRKLAAWSFNTGTNDGVTASLVAISDRGDVVIYSGNNPAVSGSWSLVGVYQLGSPCGQRCTIPFEGDLLYLSHDGLYPLSQYIQTNSLNTTVAVTASIAPTVGDLVATLSSTPGFDLATYPGRNLLLLNVPQVSTADNFQFVFNSVTKGWTQFTGWAANCWALFNDALYFGGANFVGLAFIGYSDGADLTGSGGANIIATALTAFTAFDSVGGLGRGVIKHVKEVKPYIVTGSTGPIVRVGVNVDYNLVPIVGSATLSAASGAVWDTAIWDDSGATWVGSLATYNQWITAPCYPGESVALAISISANSDTTWVATNWLVEPAGQFG